MKLDQTTARFWHANAAAWCYYSGGKFAKILQVADPLLDARKTLGDRNWLYAMFHVIFAYNNTGNHKRAYQLLGNSITELHEQADIIVFANLAFDVLKAQSFSITEMNRWNLKIEKIISKHPEKPGSTGFKRMLALFNLRLVTPNRPSGSEM